MRANGVDETLITGDTDPFDKFIAWAQTVPSTIRNPLYHWTHLELNRYFGIDVLLNEDTAREVWCEANRQLKQMPVSAIMDKFDIALIGTTDDPTDDLASHAKLANESPLPHTVVYPSFRPDRAYTVEDSKSWNSYVDRVAHVSGIKCDSLGSYMEAIKQRHGFFHDAGCRLSVVGSWDDTFAGG